MLGVAFIILPVRLMGPRMNGNLEAGVFRLALAFSGMVFLYLISGEKTFEKCGGTTGYVCKVLLPTLILPLLGLLPTILEGIQGKISLRSDWPLQILYLAFLCLCVGVMEEVMARALVNDSLVYQFRDTKKIFLIVAVVDVVVFGAAHLIGSEIRTPTAMLLAIVKVLSTGAGGLCYLFLYWKTRNLWGIAIMHGLFDFISSSGGVLLETAEGTTLSADYVSAVGESATASMAIMGVGFLISIAIAVWIWKKHLKDVDFEEMRRTW